METSIRIGSLTAIDHRIEVPLDHGRPDGERIEIYARELIAPGGAERPRLLYLEGGPGGRGPRPAPPMGWMERALRDYRVVLLDQRGTGLSHPLNRRSLARLGKLEAQAAHLAHFRADAIVEDAELLRHHLQGDEPWSVLGQSFGGFCAVSYLSRHPEGLREVMLTGGLPSIDASPEEVYRALYPGVIRRNRRYFERFPGDQEVASRIAAHLLEHDVRLPDSSPLTVQRFQCLGMELGSQWGADQLHLLLEDAFCPGSSGDEIADSFLGALYQRFSFASRPLYAILHEACWCHGGASNWAAQRVRSEFPEFDFQPGGELRFTGEMIYPWMFRVDPALAPLAEAAELLAAKPDWPELYDRAALAANTVPAAALVYFDDLYVNRDLSLRTAEGVSGLELWVTNEYQHDGLRQAAVLDRLLGMVQGRSSPTR
ncbi:MAG TPA: alpha/beta fold hydrolase [Candidatus Dormibacteraeota bacterium]|nr:alpha/beta fold hydrolase [Candidatus Dormibacteraeota bacterium]